MTFTYNATLPNDISKVRVLIGDTTEASALVTDEAITMLLAANTNIYTTAAACVDLMIAALRDVAVDVSVESVSESGSQKIATLQALKNGLKQQGVGIGATGARTAGISYTGNSIATMESHAENTDNPPPRFIEGQFGNVT